MANKIEVSAGLELFYEDKGSGSPIIFIPGWTCTTEFFEHNLDALAEHYRVLCYDPRSQGNSSITEQGNNFMQRGHDLAAFISAFKLKDVVLAGWSCGVLDAYSYLDIYGTDNARALICIDEAPCLLKQQADDWGAGTAKELRELLASITNPDQSTFMRSYADIMITRKTSQQESDWIVGQSMKTPPHIAALLMADADLADYSGVARNLDDKLPVAQIISEQAAGVATPWLSEHTPHAKVFALGGHMMFWEFPDQFNSFVLDFLRDC